MIRIEVYLPDLGEPARTKFLEGFLRPEGFMTSIVNESSKYRIKDSSAWNSLRLRTFPPSLGHNLADLEVQVHFDMMNRADDLPKICSTLAGHLRRAVQAAPHGNELEAVLLSISGCGYTTEIEFNPRMGDAFPTGYGSGKIIRHVDPI